MAEQQVVTELVIDADTSGADKFEQAMDSAADAATRGLGATTSYNAGIVAFGAGAVASALAIKGVIDQVVSANAELAGMAQLADRVGLSLRDLQGVKLGGEIAGLKSDQVNAGLEKSAQLLNDAQRNSNSLSKELDANGVSIRNANGQLITENQLLSIAADLVSRARSPQDAIAIAQMLGFTKEWVPLLEQGSAAMAGLSDEASKAGAVIDDETIRKADEFDQEWRKTSAIFGANLKAAIADALPYIDDLIKRAHDFIDDMKKARTDGGSTPWLDENNALDRTFGKVVRGGLSAVGIDPSAGISINLAPQVTQGWATFTDNLQRRFTDLQAGASDDLKKRIEDLDSWWHEKALDPAFVANAVPRMLSMATGGAFPEEPVILRRVAAPDPVSQDPLNGDAYPKSGPKSIDDLVKAQTAAQDKAQDAAQDAAAGDYSKVVARDQGKDPVDRAIDSLRRHTEQQEADTKAIGAGDAALAGFKAEAAETAAVQANGGKETDAQADKFADLRDQAIAVADALARAKVASQIDFNSKTAFLSASDVAIATQLKGLYGNDVPAALNSADAAAIRLTGQFKEISTTIENDVVSGLTDIVSGTKTASKGFADLAASVVKSIEQMVIKIAVVEPLMRGLQSSISGSGILAFLGGAPGVNANGSIAGAVGPTSVGGAPLVTSAFGNVFSAGLVVPFAAGGIPDLVSSPTIAPMAMFGEAGPEAIMPLRRGADGSLGVAGGAGAAPQVNVTLIESPNARGSVSQRQNSNGGLDIEIAVSQISAKSAATPGSPLNRVMVDQLGASQRLTRR